MSINLAAGLEIEEITSLGALETLRPEWTQLWLESAEGTPFQSPEWIIPWWVYFGDSELWGLAVRHEGRLVGFAPFCIHTDRETVRRVLLIGTGISDSLDLLAASGFVNAVAAAVVSHLIRHRDRWDMCDFQQLPMDAALPAAAVSPRFAMDLLPQDPCPVLDFPRTARSLAEAIPTDQFKKLEYYRRRLAKRGPLSMQPADEQILPELLEGLLRLHQARWTQRELPGVLDDRTIQNFHRTVAAQMLHRGMLRLYGLCCGESLIAAFYGFADRRRTYYYIGGFDPEWRHESPGMLIIGHAIEQALHEGAEAFNFLRGRESYKYTWGASDRSHYRCCFRPTPDRDS